MVITIIPAKGNSQGIPGKNLRALQGRPLLTYVLETALLSPSVDQVYVSTESPQIAEVVQAWGGQVLWRPEELTRDEVSAVDVGLHAALQLPQGDIIVLLLPTCPLLLPEDLETGLQLLTEGKPQSVCALTEVRPSTYHFLANWEPDEEIRWKQLMSGRRQGLNRQDLARQERVYAPLDLWVIGRETFLYWQTVYTDRMLGFLVPPERSVDIDYEADLVVAEYYLSRRSLLATG
jgi:CMP-N-acetylneuraminic acid synthetase